MKIVVSVLRSDIVHTLPGIWPPEELRHLLDLMDADDLGEVSDEDLLDMTIMALQDLGHQRAGECVLEAVFGATMGAGVRQNLVDDLQDDEPWQDFSDVRSQRGIFVAVVLMHQAFANRYPHPDARRIEISLHGTDSERMNDVELVHLLARGMAPTDVLCRLYDFDDGPVPQTEGVIWHREVNEKGEIALISSRQWFGSLTPGTSYSVHV